MPAVVVDVLTEYDGELTPMKDKQPIEALPADTAHDALGEGVGTWRPDWRTDHPNAVRLEDGSETRRELGVPIPDKEPEWGEGLRPVPCSGFGLAELSTPGPDSL